MPSRAHSRSEATVSSETGDARAPLVRAMTRCLRQDELDRIRPIIVLDDKWFVDSQASGWPVCLASCSISCRHATESPHDCYALVTAGSKWHGRNMCLDQPQRPNCTEAGVIRCCSTKQLKRLSNCIAQALCMSTVQR